MKHNKTRGTGKGMRKFIAVLITLVMITSMAHLAMIPSIAADPPGIIRTVTLMIGEEVYDVVKVVDGTAMQHPVTPDKTEWPAETTGFLGWWDEQSGGTQSTFPMIINEDIWLYARFDNKCTITYIDRGKVVATQIYELGNKITLMSNVSPSTPNVGETFAGWKDKLTEDTVTSETVVNRDMTLVADYNKFIIVTFIAAGSPTNTELVVPGEYAVPPARPIDYQTHTFRYWSKSINGEEYIFKAEPVNSDIVLYAVWQPALTTENYPYEYIINFYDGVDRVDRQYVKSGLYATPSVYVEDGVYEGKGEFIGWFYKPDKIEYQFYFNIPINDNYDLYAKWKTQPFNLTYVIKTDTGTGTGTAPIDNNGYAYGTSVQLTGEYGFSPPDGYIFIGWKIGNNLYYPHNSFIITGNTIAEAFYIPIPTALDLITVQYYANLDDPVPAVRNTIIAPKDNFQMNRNAALTLYGEWAYTHDNYTLIGWNTQADGKGTPYKFGDVIETLSASITLYGVWEQNGSTNETKYTVKYDPGTYGTFGAQETGGLLHGAATPAAPETTGEPGWEFIGWNPEWNDTVTSNVTYVAQWRQIFYTVTYTPGEHGAFTAQGKTDLIYNDLTPAAPTSTPGEPGWKFTGWKPAIAPTVTGDATYIAQWEQYYTVIYAPGAHGTFTQVTHSPLTPGQDTPAAPAITGEPGWVFAGWSPSVSAKVTGNATYVAQWSLYEPPPDNNPPETDPPETDPPETDPPETDPPETDPPETDPPETEPPVNPQPPEPPYIPGGTDFFVPPIPMESSSTIVETEDGGWLELDENGTPLGKWEWDGTEWVFEEYEPPLSDMPMTNIQSLAGFYIVMLIMLTSCSIRVIAQIKQRKSHSKF